MHYIINQVQKRDGSVVAFKSDKITEAVFKSMSAVNNGNRSDAQQIADRVVNMPNLFCCLLYLSNMFHSFLSF